MVNYIHGEFYKVLRRKYPYICLALLLAGAGLLVWGWAFTNAHGNHVDFAAGGGMAVSLLVVGLYATVLVCDMVFSEQYKFSTLKNEVAYGLPRRRIYVGKLLVAAAVGLALALIVLAAYEALCYAVLLPSPDSGGVIGQVLYCLAASIPQWLAVLALCNLLFFLMRSSTVAAFVVIGVLLVPSNLFTIMGLLLHPAFTTAAAWTPDAIVINAYKYVGDGSYLAVSWALGAAWVAVCTLLGLWAMRRKEIH